MSRVDAHHHLWDTARRAYPWMDGPWADPLRGVFTPESLAPLAAAHAIEATVVVQAVADIDETRELLSTAASSALVAGVVGWVDLRSPAVGESLAALAEGPGGARLVGIRHQVQDEPDPAWLLRSDVQAGLAAVGAAGLAYDLLLKPRDLPAAVEAARRQPELRFVVDHLAKPDIAARMTDPWTAGLAELATAPNVTAKVSGLVTEADWQTWSSADLGPYVEHAVGCFGPERLMFGSDWPVCLLAADYHRVVETTEVLLDAIGLTPAEREQVFGATARRVYDLPPPG